MHCLAVYDLPSLHFEPRRVRPHGIGYWSGHLAFAYDLVASVRPRVFVELGTHFGESYFGFCQAITEHKLACRSFAVDTWRGDIHTGAYADDVFREVDAYNSENYSTFSTLLRSTFDNAVDRFEAESIDILHIDGVHTYEAVLHDFETWWPKLRAGGILLLHDSVERTHDFGIWRLVQDVRQRFRVAEFVHSHGLAVILKPGQQELSGILALLFSCDDDRTCSIQRYYEIFADHLNHRVQLERQANPAFDIVSQLFWRAAGESFSEAASIRSSNVIGLQTTQVKLPILARTQEIDQLRIVVSHKPAPLKLHSIDFLKRGVGSVVKCEAGLNITSLRSAGLQCWRSDADSAALVTEAPESLSFVIGKALLGGGSLDGVDAVIIEISALDRISFSAALSRAAEAELLREQKESARLRHELNEAKSQLRDAKGRDTLAGHLRSWFRSSGN